MNENYEQRRRAGQEGEGPRILSIQEPEVEERAPPGISTRYPPEWSRSPQVSPRIVEEPKRSGKGRILLVILIVVLICSNVALFRLHQQQEKEIKEQEKEIKEIIGKILYKSLLDIHFEFEKEGIKAGTPLLISVNGLTPDLFSKFGLKSDEVKAEIIISKSGKEVVTSPLALGTSQINVMLPAQMDAGSYDVKLKITYREVTTESNYGKITIQEA